MICSSFLMLDFFVVIEQADFFIVAGEDDFGDGVEVFEFFFTVVEEHVPEKSEGDDVLELF